MQGRGYKQENSVDLQCTLVSRDKIETVVRVVKCTIRQSGRQKRDAEMR